MSGRAAPGRRRSTSVAAFLLFIMISLMRRVRGSPTAAAFLGTSCSPIQKQQQRPYHRSLVVAHDSRRKRRPHYLPTGPAGEDGFDHWEFGLNPGWGEEHTGRTPKLKKTRRGGGAEEEEKAGDEEEAVEEDERFVDDIGAATACLSNFCLDARLERLREIAGKRTGSVRFVFENVANPNNLWACLRTIDAFGVQYVHVVVDAAHYRKPHRLAQAKSAMGTQKWLTVTEHQSATECIAALKTEGYTVLASDLKPGTTPSPIRDVDWTAQKVAVVMGNEERGITEEMRALCDGTYYIPMIGFAESFNLSVSTAVTLAFLSSLGGLKHGDLPQAEKDRLVLRWLIKSVPQGAAILRREGLLVEDERVLPSSNKVLGFKM